MESLTDYSYLASLAEHHDIPRHGGTKDCSLKLVAHRVVTVTVFNDSESDLSFRKLFPKPSLEGHVPRHWQYDSAVHLNGSSTAVTINT